MKYKQIGWLVSTRDSKMQYDPNLYPDHIREGMEKNGIVFEEKVYAEAKEDDYQWPDSVMRKFEQENMQPYTINKIQGTVRRVTNSATEQVYDDVSE